MAEPEPELEITRPTLRGWLAHLGRTALFATALLAPIYGVSASGWLDTPQPERAMYWKLAAIAGWYTTLALLLAGILLRRAWRIHSNGTWPDPAAFVAVPTVVRRGLWMDFHSGSALLLAIAILAAIASAWQAMQLPALFLGGYGDGIVGTEARCPEVGEAPAGDPRP